MNVPIYMIKYLNVAELYCKRGEINLKRLQRKAQLRSRGRVIR